MEKDKWTDFLFNSKVLFNNLYSSMDLHSAD